MVGESSTVTNDPTGVLVILTQQVNELTLAIYTVRLPGPQINIPAS